MEGVESACKWLLGGASVAALWLEMLSPLMAAWRIVKHSGGGVASVIPVPCLDVLGDGWRAAAAAAVAAAAAAADY